VEDDDDTYMESSPKGNVYEPSPKGSYNDNDNSSIDSYKSYQPPMPHPSDEDDDNNLLTAVLGFSASDDIDLSEGSLLSSMHHHATHPEDDPEEYPINDDELQLSDSEEC